MMHRHRDGVDGDGASGATLLELLVVLAIIALAVAAVVPRFVGTRDTVALKTATAELSNGLRHARTVAVSSNNELAVTFEGRTVRGIPGGSRVSIPETATMSVTSARQLMRDDGMPQIVFFPDGSSSGGEITIKDAGRVVTVRIAWLTGAITIEEAKP